jgi:hypothetical protein
MELEFDDEDIEVGETVEVSNTWLMNLNRFPPLVYVFQFNNAIQFFLLEIHIFTET